MGLDIVPERYRYTCDLCGKEKEAGSKVPYPYDWCIVNVNQGYQSEMERIQKFLCKECKDRFLKLTNNMNEL